MKKIKIIFVVVVIFLMLKILLEAYAYMSIYMALPSFEGETRNDVMEWYLSQKNSKSFLSKYKIMSLSEGNEYFYPKNKQDFLKRDYFMQMKLWEVGLYGSAYRMMLYLEFNENGQVQKQWVEFRFYE